MLLVQLESFIYHYYCIVYFWTCHNLLSECTTVSCVSVCIYITAWQLSNVFMPQTNMSSVILLCIASSAILADIHVPYYYNPPALVPWYVCYYNPPAYVVISSWITFTVTIIQDRMSIKAHHIFNQLHHWPPYSMYNNYASVSVCKRTWTAMLINNDLLCVQAIGG